MHPAPDGGTALAQHFSGHRTFKGILDWFAAHHVTPAESPPHQSVLFREPRPLNQDLAPIHLMSISNRTSLARGTHHHCKTFVFPENQRAAFTEHYRAGQTELTEICEEVTGQMGRHFYPGERIITGYWDNHKPQWHRLHARNEKIVAPAVEDTILRLAHGLVKRGAKNARDGIFARIQFSLFSQCDGCRENFSAV
jgi:hypothetical protein